MSKLKKVILAGLFIAVGVVLNRFLSIKTPIITISLTFIPHMLSGILLGPWWTMITAGMTDLIGALLFPFGPYFVGYTFSAALAGLIYGLLLYRKKPMSRKKFIVRLVIATLLVVVICNAILNSLWIYITTKKAVSFFVPTRMIKQLIMLPIQIVVIFLLDLGLDKMGAYKFLGINYDVDDELDKQKVKAEIEKMTAETEQIKTEINRKNRYCAYCGNPIPENADVCPNCGSKKIKIRKRKTND